MNLKCQIGQEVGAQRVEEGWDNPNNGRESGREDPTKLHGLNIFFFSSFFSSKPFQARTRPGLVGRFFFNFEIKIKL